LEQATPTRSNSPVAAEVTDRTRRLVDHTTAPQGSSSQIEKIYCMTNSSTKPAAPFSGYQKFVVGMLAFLQFTIVLDFMIISPLGAVMMPALDVGPRQFGLTVSAYAFSAGISGFLAAGFADRFDRKKLLLFFYVGFLLGTALCAIASTYQLLLVARIVTGLFGGVIGSVVLAIATDLFAPEMRGRVMGAVQTAFAASQVLGIPVGLYLANLWDWHVPFAMIVAVGAIVGLVIAARMKPVDMHLASKAEHNPLRHILRTVTKPEYLLAFLITALLTTGGSMLMPFGSVYTVNNLEIGVEQLPTIYLVTGVCTIFAGPLIGRASDRFGKLPVFLLGVVLSTIMILIFTHLGPTPLLAVIAINVVLFVSVFARMIPARALLMAIPDVTKRGAFNAVSASIQQLSGGIASVISGLIIVQNPGGQLVHFDTLGYVVIGTSLVSLYLMYRINRSVSG
jgi:predicted MFS family arabinose efflux permease